MKLALHRLGFKGLTEIQRGSPSWWKCTWLVTLLSGKFNEKLAKMRYEEKIFEMASQDEEPWADAFSDTLGLGPNLPQFSYRAGSWLTESRMCAASSGQASS